VWYSNTQNDFCPGAAIFSLHTLASPCSRNVNYDEKQLTGGEKNLSCSFYLYRFRKYVSYGFPLTTFCNPGIHYETTCVYIYIYIYIRIYAGGFIMCACIYIYIYIHTHTHTHTHIKLKNKIKQHSILFCLQQWHNNQSTPNNLLHNYRLCLH
jgi:hypothetical protein